MAYMSFAPWETAGAITRPEATVEDAANFSPLELRVIALGERSDIAHEVAAQSRTARLLERVFGIKPTRPLANPRLEHLRRFASLARYHPDRLSEDEIEALLSAGFTTGQTYGLLGYFSDRQRSAPLIAA
ncbi:hypothetical protein SAMN05444678_111126 [Sphingomonas sp. YR710]|jgi:uncharacterized protein YciW|uniref:hypothetical protein n=1 Tax=Sphingomonas sp. YR710 TaxID=1882773 RepID=UPI000883323A|nr:hypothetical protein [Sphingomonas sp. YR710]SDD30030.1 hypothetical protein SAMN05444678_111126 [Sphingomonas sp. YR710]